MRRILRQIVLLVSVTIQIEELFIGWLDFGVTSAFPALGADTLALDNRAA